MQFCDKIQLLMSTCAKNDATCCTCKKCQEMKRFLAGRRTDIEESGESFVSCADYERLNSTWKLRRLNTSIMMAPTAFLNTSRNTTTHTTKRRILYAQLPLFRLFRSLTQKTTNHVKTRSVARHNGIIGVLQTPCQVLGKPC